MYSQKIIQNLKPSWYLALGKNAKLKEQRDLKRRHKEAWNNKPEQISSATKIIANSSIDSVTKGKIYLVQNHFCTLISTIYDTNWNQFITIKNDSGYTVKMNLNKFRIAK